MIERVDTEDKREVVYVFPDDLSARIWGSDENNIYGETPLPSSDADADVAPSLADHPTTPLPVNLPLLMAKAQTK
jgi:hypothetical protein